MSSSKPLVIVLSRNYSTGLGVIRSLGSAGYDVNLIASVKQAGSSIICSCSKYVSKSVEVLCEKIQGDDGSKIIDEIMKYSSSKGAVLFPADDFTASIVANNYDKLSEYFLMPKMCGDKTLIEAMDKSYQSSLAKAVGLETILEWSVDLRKEIVVPADVIYPCFVKPAQSVNGSKAEMRVCNNEDELLKHLSKMKEFYSDRDVILQEYLTIDRELDLSGLCLDDEIIIPAMIEKIRVSKHEQGVTMAGKMVDFNSIGDNKQKIIEMLKSLRYYGMFDMELFECDGRIYFNEINLRSGGPNYSYFLNGVNLPDIFVKEITGNGHNQSEEKMSVFGKTFVYEKVAWEDYIHSYMKKNELNQLLKQVDYTLLADENDPAPGKCFYKRIRLSALKHKALGILGRE